MVNGMNDLEVKEFLDEKYDRFNRAEFIVSDPVCVPHSFADPRNIEIAAFLTATISWGQRKTIIQNAWLLLKMMGNDPYDFIMHAAEDECKALSGFTHRTFNGIDTMFFIKALKNIYIHYGGLKGVFEHLYMYHRNIRDALTGFRSIFFEIPFPPHAQKHVADVSKNASAKRLNMFLRWMVRKDDRGVDFGLWPGIPASALYMPLDVHTGNTARKLGLLKRRQNDWQAVEELTHKVRGFDADDPVKYDFALFGLGAIEDF